MSGWTPKVHITQLANQLKTRCAKQWAFIQENGNGLLTRLPALPVSEARLLSPERLCLNCRRTAIAAGDFQHEKASNA